MEEQFLSPLQAPKGQAVRAGGIDTLMRKEQQQAALETTTERKLMVEEGLRNYVVARIEELETKLNVATSMTIEAAGAGLVESQEARIKKLETALREALATLAEAVEP